MGDSKIVDTRMTDWLTWLRQRTLDHLPPLTVDNARTVAEDLARAARLLAALADMPSGFWQADAAIPAAVLPEAPRRVPAGHRMVRRLRGGYLPDLRISVPEVAVRRLELAHGDYLVPEPAGAFPDGRKKYRFALAEHPLEPAADFRERGELAMGIVELGPQQSLVVHRTVDGTLPSRIDLSPEDVQYLNIAPGDVVDLAYWADEPEDVRVSWVHRTRDEEPPAAAPVRPPVRRRVAEDDDDGPLDDLDPVSLAGKRVLVVGCEPKRREYEAAIRRLGGQMDWAEGTEGQARLEAAIRRADAVVLLTRFIRHQSFWDATALAKSYGVKVAACTKLGIRSVSRAAVDLLAQPSQGPVIVAEREMR